MKTFIIIFSLFFFSCNQKGNDLVNIEVMKYRKDFDSNLNPIFRPSQYTYIDDMGNAKVINYYHFGKDDKFISYKISNQKLNEIFAYTVNLDDEYFRLKEKDFTDEIYCGLDEYTRYRIKFKNRKSISFVLLNHNIKIEKYTKLKIENFDSNNLSRVKISDNDTLNLIQFKNNFENFVTKFQGQQLYPRVIQKVRFIKPKK